MIWLKAICVMQSKRIWHRGQKNIQQVFWSDKLFLMMSRTQCWNWGERDITRAKYAEISKRKNMSSTWIVRMTHWTAPDYLHFTSCQTWFFWKILIGDEMWIQGMEIMSQSKIADILGKKVLLCVWCNMKIVMNSWKLVRL